METRLAACDASHPSAVTHDARNAFRRKGEARSIRRVKRNRGRRQDALVVGCQQGGTSER
jgi:hypothetical protein